MVHLFQAFSSEKKERVNCSPEALPLDHHPIFHGDSEGLKTQEVNELARILGSQMRITPSDLLGTLSVVHESRRGGEKKFLGELSHAMK